MLLLHHLAALPALLRDIRGGSPFQGIGFYFWLDSIAATLVVYLAVRAAVGSRATLTEAGGALGRRFIAWLGAAARSSVMITLFSLLLLVPGMVRWVSYVLVGAIVLFEPPMRANQVLELSRARMQGKRAAAFAAYSIVLLVGLLPVIVQGFLSWDELDPDAPDLPATPLDIVFTLYETSVNSLMSLLSATLYLKTAPANLFPIAQRASAAAQPGRAG
jgi:hypothetical protein